MPSRRAQKMAEAVREVVGMAILRELKDPRVQDVTVTYVEVSGDLRQAKVHVSVMGNEAKQNLSLRGLQSAAGFLQSKLKSRIEARYTPRLEFLLDQGVKKSIAIAQILDRVLPRDADTEAMEVTEADLGDEEAEAAQEGEAPPASEDAGDRAAG